MYEQDLIITFVVSLVTMLSLVVLGGDGGVVEQKVLNCEGKLKQVTREATIFRRSNGNTVATLKPLALDCQS